MKTLELHYPMIQFLITWNICICFLYLQIPCEQLVSPTPNERETTASNRLLFHGACASSSRPPDAFDVNFMCQFLKVFQWKRFGTKMSKFLAKNADKRMNQTFLKVLCISSLWSNLRLQLPSLRAEELSWSLNTTLQTIRNNMNINYDRTKAGLYKLLQATGCHQNWKMDEHVKHQIQAMYTAQSQKIMKSFSIIT